MQKLYFSGCWCGRVLQLGGVVRAWMSSSSESWALFSWRGDGVALSAWERVLQHGPAGRAAEQFSSRVTHFNQV